MKRQVLVLALLLGAGCSQKDGGVFGCNTQPGGNKPPTTVAAEYFWGAMEYTTTTSSSLDIPIEVSVAGGGVPIEEMLVSYTLEAGTTATPSVGADFCDQATYPVSSYSNGVWTAIVTQSPCIFQGQFVSLHAHFDRRGTYTIKMVDGSFNSTGIGVVIPAIPYPEVKITVTGD